MPAHVPVVFLDAGATGMFSAFCKAELAKVDLTEEDFGGYAHVNARCKAAKKKVDSGAPTTPNERLLAQCSASHLQQDALFREGRGRFDPCATLVPGYDGRRAPVMPLIGQGNQAGTEEGLMQAHEQQSIANRGLKPGDTYPRADMNADADARLRTIPRLQNQCPPTTPQGGAPGGAPPPPVASAGAAGGTAGSAVAGAGGAGAAAIDGKDLIDCINNFRKLAEKQMIQDCIDNKNAYHAEACGNFHGGGTPAASPAAYRAQQQARLDALPAGHPARAKTQDRINRSANAECRYNDAVKLTTGPNPNPQGNGTIPPPVDAAGGRDVRVRDVGADHVTAGEHLVYEFARSSGPSHVDCHALGLRHDERVGRLRDASESYVIQVEGRRAHVLWRKPGFLTGLWRSPTGRVFVVDPSEGVFMNPDPAPRAAPWHLEPLPGVLLGVWGLDDACVFAWGLGLHFGEFVMYRWDGARWHGMPSPGHVLSVHGVERDLVYAVGNHGLIARWDGARWTSVPSPTRAVLSDVHVVSAEEMYAAGAGMALLEGSTHGWAEVLTGDEMLPCAAKLGDVVYVGAALSGLMRLDGRALSPVKPRLRPLDFDVRPGSGLLMACPDVIAHTVDGEEFNGTWVKTFADLAANDPVPWTVSAGYLEDDGPPGGDQDPDAEP